MELIVTGPKRDLHSGLGGMVHNPSQVIAEIVAQLHDADGRVTVPGFYDDVADLSPQERDLLRQSDLTPAEWEEQIGAPKDWGEPNFSRVERSVARPTLEINGIYGGYTGSGFKTVIGARAGVKISCRLVPNQRAHRIYQQVRDYLLSLVPPTVTAEIRDFGTADPALTDIHHPAMQAAIRAYGHHWTNPAILTRSGGSLPIVADLQNKLGLPIILMGFALPDAAAHGPDENFSLEMFDKGISTIIHFMQEWASG
jgi:acetylornithine deacetylase/succinyl-diaminopimelate desuccinylase-like protein